MLSDAGYVNAQYRFVMKPTFDGARYLSNPDLPLPWHDIVQVLVNANSDVTVAGCGVSGAEPAAACPICLAPPVAPRMTRCGHVYCYPCILHYLIVSENGSMQQRSAPRRQSKRCPICWDDVTRSDLKAVHWIDARAAAAEHTNAFLAQRAAETGGLALLDHASELHEHAGLMTLRLVARPQDQTLALPRNAAHWPPLNSRVPTCAESDAVIFARFMLATPEFLCASLRADIAQIDAEAISLQQWKADELSLEFLRVARAELVQTLDATSSVHSSTADVHLAAEADTSPAAYFYFQAASGQTVFLHPIDIKVLLAHFGTYADFPDTLLVVVQNMEEGTMDEQLRRRCKYLAQPMSSDVTFIEVDWPRTAELLAQVQGVVPWQAWEDTLLQRQRRHQDKAVREERARQRAEKCARRAEASAQSEPEMPLIQTDFPLSFRESAMVGAEMFFPTHPGADPTPFPSMTPATDTAPFSAPDQPRTVWGTPAAAGAAAATSPPSREMDDAWNALEASASSEQARPQRQRQKRGKPKLILTGGGRGSL